MCRSSYTQVPCRDGRSGGWVFPSEKLKLWQVSAVHGGHEHAWQWLGLFA
jgi:hypothetical protein